MKIILILLVVAMLLGALWFYGMRIRRALANTIPLHNTADQFAAEYVIGEPGAPKLSYVALGDSTAYGVGASTLEHTYPYAVASAIASTGYQVHVQTMGRSGARLQEIVEVQLPKVGVGADLISVSVGGNDATHLTAPWEYRALADRLMTGLAATAAKEVLVASTTDMALTPSIPPIAKTVVGLWAEQ